MGYNGRVEGIDRFQFKTEPGLRRQATNLRKYMKKQKWFTQTVLFQTLLFGKEYFWLQDVDSHIYLARAVPNVIGSNFNSNTGVTEDVIDGLKPVFA